MEALFCVKFFHEHDRENYFVYKSGKLPLRSAVGDNFTYVLEEELEKLEKKLRITYPVPLRKRKLFRLHGIILLGSSLDLMSSPALQRLFEDLTAAIRADPRNPKVSELLCDYIWHGTDWKDYAHFSTKWYARNLVARNELLELLVICWDLDQKTYCHNHPSHCWLSVLEGQMKEDRYVYANTSATTGQGPLLATGSSVFNNPQVAYIDDGIALHSLGSHGGKRAVTLHVYSPPVSQCNTYNLETGEVSTRKMTYYSVDKVPC